MRFGLKDVGELPSMEEFEKLVAESFQGELIPAEDAAEQSNAPQSEAIEESVGQKRGCVVSKLSMPPRAIRVPEAANADGERIVLTQR